MPISTNYPAVNPTLNLDFVNSKTLDPRITFTRSTTATYYDGKTTALAEQNLISNSPAISGYSKVRLTVPTTNITAPDGTSTASELLPDTTATSTHYVTTATGLTNDGLTRTYSVFAKANTYTKMALISFDAGSYVSVDLSAGTRIAYGLGATPNSPATASSSITSVGNGWYRVSLVTTDARELSPAIMILNNAYTTEYPLTYNWTPDGTSSIYAWGMQAESRSFAGLYTPTTGTRITNYIPVLLTAPINTPRFSANPITGQVFGLLLEGQRTNNLYYSQDFTQANWTKTNLTVYNTYMNVAPDGTVSAQSLVEDSSNTLKQLTQTFSIAGATPADSSIFLKNISSTWVAITSSTATTNYYCICNLSTGQIGYYGRVASGTPSTGNGDGVVTAQMVNVGNGWYRCQMVSSVASTFTSFTIIPLRSVGNTIPTYNFANWNYTGNSSSACYIWGAQFEYSGSTNAEQVTSYIPTGVSQVTRADDKAVIAGTNFSSWYNSDQGSLFLDYYQGSTPYVTRFGYISNTANTSWIQTPINFGGTTNNTSWIVSDLGINASSASSSINNTLGAENKVAMSYSSGNSAWASNGGNVLTSSNTRVSGTTGNTLIFSTGTNGYFYIKKFAYYPEVLTSTQLQALTGS